LQSNTENKEGWSVSHWNNCKELLEATEFAQKITIHDQTLRDGTQFSGIELSADDRVEIAARLAGIGVQRIEAGRVSDDPSNLDVIKRIVSLKTQAEIMGFVELSVDDVRRAADCGVDGVMVCFPSNEKAITEKMGIEVQAITDIAIEMVSVANSLGLKTIMFPTDASRATPDAYKKMITDIAREVNFDGLTFVDTIGSCSPRAIPFIFQFLRTFNDKPLEVHFHNDFGLATANTITALTYGASGAHTTVLGIGERAGNAAMEEVVMILLTMYGKNLGLKMERLYDLSMYVGKAAALQIAPNKPIVGNKIFEIECYENLLGYFNVPEDVAVKYTFPFKWDIVGHPPMDVALGSESGIEALDIILHLSEKSSLSPEIKEKVLSTIKQKSLEEKRSFLKDEILSIIAEFEG
jgi:isopropylmalate/homocitrate/citramalate synthase